MDLNRRPRAATHFKQGRFYREELFPPIVLPMLVLFLVCLCPADDFNAEKYHCGRYEDRQATCDGPVWEAGSRYPRRCIVMTELTSNPVDGLMLSKRLCRRMGWLRRPLCDSITDDAYREEEDVLIQLSKSSANE